MELRTVETKNDTVVEKIVSFSKTELAIGGGVLIAVIILVMQYGYGLKCGGFALIPPQQPMSGIESAKC